MDVELCFMYVATINSRLGGGRVGWGGGFGSKGSL